MSYFQENLKYCSSLSQIEAPSQIRENNRNQEDLMSVLMQLEKPTTKATVDSSDDEAAARSLLEQITPAANTNQPHVVEYSMQQHKLIFAYNIYMRVSSFR